MIKGKTIKRFISKMIALVILVSVILVSVMPSGFAISNASYDITNKKQLLKAVIERDKAEDSTPGTITVRTAINAALDWIDSGVGAQEKSDAIDLIMEQANSSSTFKKCTPELQNALREMLVQYAPMDPIRRELVKQAFGKYAPADKGIRITSEIKAFYDASTVALNKFPNVKNEINKVALDDQNNNDGFKFLLSIMVFASKNQRSPLVEELDETGYIDIRIIGHQEMQDSLDTYLQLFHDKGVNQFTSVDSLFMELENHINAKDATERAEFVNFLNTVKDNDALGNIDVVKESTKRLIVNDVSEFTAALNNSNVKGITLGADITGDVSASRNGAINFGIEFGQHKLIGNLNITANNVRTMTFNKDASYTDNSIVGNLTVAAIRATLNNNLDISGKVTLNGISSSSYNASGNQGTGIIMAGAGRLNLSGAASNAQVNITSTNPVILAGVSNNVTISAPNANVKVTGSVNKLTVAATATATNITLASGAVVTSLITDADIDTNTTLTIEVGASDPGSITGPVTINKLVAPTTTPRSGSSSSRYIYSGVPTPSATPTTTTTTYVTSSPTSLPRGAYDMIAVAKSVLEAPSTSAKDAIAVINVLIQELTSEGGTLQDEQKKSLKAIIDIAYEKVRTITEVSEEKIDQAIADLDMLEEQAKALGVSINLNKAVKNIGTEGEVKLSVATYNKLLEKNIGSEFVFGDISYTIPVGKLIIPEGTTKLNFSGKKLTSVESATYSSLVGTGKNASFFTLDIVGDKGDILFKKTPTIPFKLQKTFKNQDEANDYAMFFVNKSGDMTVEVLRPQAYNQETSSFEFRLEHFSTYMLLQTKTSFADISKHSWAQTSIKNLVARQVVVGMGPKEYAPDNSVTRAQFITMLVKNFGLLDKKAKTNFVDVNKNAWYYSSVASAFNKGIVKGTNTNTFEPDKAITRAEMTVMMNNVIAVLNLKATPIFTDKNYIDDFSIPDYARKSVSLITRIGLMTGYPGNRFSPNMKATRAEAAVVIYKLFSVE